MKRQSEEKQGMHEQGWFFIPRPTWRDRLRERWYRLLRRDPWRGWQEVGYTTERAEDQE